MSLNCVVFLCILEGVSKFVYHIILGLEFGVFGGLITPVCSLILSWSLPVNQDYFEMLCLALP